MGQVSCVSSIRPFGARWDWRVFRSQNRYPLLRNTRAEARTLAGTLSPGGLACKTGVTSSGNSHEMRKEAHEMRKAWRPIDSLSPLFRGVETSEAGRGQSFADRFRRAAGPSPAAP